MKAVNIVGDERKHCPFRHSTNPNQTSLSGAAADNTGADNTEAVVGNTAAQVGKTAAEVDKTATANRAN